MNHLFIRNPSDLIGVAFVTDIVVPSAHGHHPWVSFMLRSVIFNYRLYEAQNNKLNQATYPSIHTNTE